MEFVLFSLSWTRPHRFLGTWRRLGNSLHGLGFRRLPSLRLPSRVLPVQSSTLLFLVLLGDGPSSRLSVPQDTHLARGVILLPTRDVGYLAIRLRTRIHHLRLACNGTICRTKRTIFVLPHWTCFSSTSLRSSRQPPNPWFNLPPSDSTSWRSWVSSQQSSNLAWFGHMRSACNSAQRKFEAKVSEGKSLSSILTSVSRTERVSDSPCQGRAVRVNSQVFDLMGSKPSESRSIPMSVREAATLETALRGVMESYNFQLWTVTALFRFLGDSGCCPMDDPLLDQFQRSFSRGAENVAAALASTTAFVTAKRRESFLTHMVPSVTDAQKRKLLSDPLFDQRDLFAPASFEAAREAARDVSLYRGAQSRPSTLSGSNQRRQFHSSASRGRPHSSPLSASRRPPAPSSSGRFQPKKKSSDSPKKRGGFRR